MQWEHKQALKFNMIAPHAGVYDVIVYTDWLVLGNNEDGVFG